MTGTITVNGKRYFFRDDHCHSRGLWAWDIHDTSDKPTTNKWASLPSRVESVELFDLDNPPRTVGWFPFY